jgi:hypothetical protein
MNKLFSFYENELGAKEFYCVLKEKSKATPNFFNPNIVLNNINNKLYDYLNECFRYANWNSVNLLRKLPKLPLDRRLTDNEVYQYFNLTEEEINHINKMISWR